MGGEDRENNEGNHSKQAGAFLALHPSSSVYGHDGHRGAPSTGRVDTGPRLGHRPRSEEGPGPSGRIGERIHGAHGTDRDRHRRAPWHRPRHGVRRLVEAGAVDLVNFDASEGGGHRVAPRGAPVPCGRRRDGAPRGAADRPAPDRGRPPRHLCRMLRRPRARSDLAGDVGEPTSDQGRDARGNARPRLRADPGCRHDSAVSRVKGLAL